MSGVLHWRIDRRRAQTLPLVLTHHGKALKLAELHNLHSQTHLVCLSFPK